MASFMNKSFTKIKQHKKSSKGLSRSQVVKSVAIDAADVKPPPASEWTTELAHATRDIIKGIDYLVQYNSHLDAAKLKQKVPPAVQKQIDLLIDASRQMAVVNYFRFDKCPHGVLHFMQQYLLSLPHGVFSSALAHEILTAVAGADPLERIRVFKRMFETAPGRNFLRRSFLFFHHLLQSSSDQEAALDNLVRLFVICFFRMAMKSNSKYQKRMRAMRFLIQRAHLIFEDGVQTEEALQVLVSADRGLGTDGILFLIESKMNYIKKGFADMDYGDEEMGLRQELLAVRKEMTDMHKRIEEFGNKQTQLAGTFTDMWKDCNKMVEMVAPTYEQLPKALDDEEEGVEGSEVGGMDEDMQMMDALL